MTEPFIVRSLLKNHIKWLVSKGCQVSVMCSAGDDIEWIESQGANVFLVSIKRNPSIIYDIKTLFEMVSIISRFKPHIVHYSTPKSSLLTPLAIKLSFSKSKIIFTVRGRVYENKSKIIKEIFKRIDKFSCKVANKVIFISDEMRKDFITEKIVASEKSILIGSGSSNGFDTSIFRKPSKDEKTSAKKYFGIQKTRKVFCFVGRLSKDKGVEDLFSIILKLSKKHPSACFLLVGKVEFDLKNLLDDLNINEGQIFFSDWLSEIHKAYWASDIMIFPSFREGFGNVCIESILCGVPVLSYDVIGCRESVNNDISGYLVPFRDVRAIIEKASYLYENDHEVNRMANEGSLWASKEFDQMVIWNGIYRIYSDLITYD